MGNKKEGKEDVDILPIIIGVFIKREGREILTMRIVDRVLRSLFPTNL